MKTYKVKLTVKKTYEVISLNESAHLAEQEARQDLENGGFNLTFTNREVESVATQVQDKTETKEERVTRLVKELANREGVQVLALSL